MRAAFYPMYFELFVPTVVFGSLNYIPVFENDFESLGCECVLASEIVFESLYCKLCALATRFVFEPSWCESTVVLESVRYLSCLFYQVRGSAPDGSSPQGYI